MLFIIELQGNLTSMNVDVYGNHEPYREATREQPSEGGYFEISHIKKDGKDITARLDKCKGLMEQIEKYIEENYTE